MVEFGRARRRCRRRRVTVGDARTPPDVDVQAVARSRMATARGGVAEDRESLVKLRDLLAPLNSHYLSGEGEDVLGRNQWH